MFRFNQILHFVEVLGKRVLTSGEILQIASWIFQRITAAVSREMLDRVADCLFQETYAKRIKRNVHELIDALLSGQGIKGAIADAIIEGVLDCIRYSLSIAFEWFKSLPDSARYTMIGVTGGAVTGALIGTYVCPAVGSAVGGVVGAGVGLAVSHMAASQ